MAEEYVCQRSDKRKYTIEVVISEEIVISILTKLSLQTLLRLQCVCKSWHALISDPYFISLHVEWARRNHKLAIMPHVSDTQQVITIYNYEVGGNVANLLTAVGFTEPLEYPMRPLHSNGLLLLNTSHELLLVCNPIMGEIAVLPKCSPCISRDSYSYRRAGFGFIPGTNTCKVGQYFYRSVDTTAKTCSIGFEVFTLGVDSCWRAIDDPPFPIVRSFPACVGGVIYFRICNILHDSTPEFILSFNLKDEKFATVPPPSCFPKLEQLEGRSFNLFDVEGVLYFLDFARDKTNINLWMYQEGTNRTTTWVPKYHVDFPFPVVAFIPISVRRGKLLLNIRDPDCSSWLDYYDPASKSFEKVVHYKDLKLCRWLNHEQHLDDGSFFQAISYVDSLISLRKLGLQCVIFRPGNLYKCCAN